MPIFAVVAAVSAVDSTRRAATRFCDRALVLRFAMTCSSLLEGNTTLDVDPPVANFWSNCPSRALVSSCTILSPRPGRKLTGADPLSNTLHSTSGPVRNNSTRIHPSRPANACRAAFVMSSYTIIPSNQHRSGGSHKRRAARTRSIFIWFSLDRLIDRHRLRRYAAASVRIPCSGICRA